MSPHNELLQKIGIVRSRWKAFLWVRGLAWVLGVAVGSMLIGLALMNSGNISAWTVNGVRLGILIAIVFTVGYAAAVFGTIFSRRRAGLPSGNIILSAARVAFYGGP